MNAVLAHPEIRRWLIIVTVMTASTMQIIDATIANVALPHMQAALSATPDSVTWVLTSYIIMQGIATPATGWLEARIGRRVLFAGAMIGFTVSSAACGFATSLGMMVASRAIQGIFAALIGPLALSTMLDSSPPEKQASAMTIYTMGITVGPILGPVAGGWLTANYDWRWVFFVNVPFGLIATIGILALIDRKDLPRRRFDYFGFGLLGVGLASFQLMLDRGTHQDWFESSEILIEAGVAASAFWIFVVHTITRPVSLLPRALFQDRNFVLGVLFTVMIMSMSMACQALLAPMLQTLMGYDALEAGLMMAPRAAMATIMFPIISVVARHVDPRVLVAFGVAMIGIAQWMMAHFELGMGRDLYLYSTLLQAVGISSAFLPLNLLTFSSIGNDLRTEAAAFLNLARSIAGSIGIAAMAVLLARNIQVSHSDLAAAINLTGIPVPASLPIADLPIGGTAMYVLDAEVNRQAMMVAYIDDFWVMAWVALAFIPLVLLMRRAEAKEEDVPVLVE